MDRPVIMQARLGRAGAIAAASATRLRHAPPLFGDVALAAIAAIDVVANREGLPHWAFALSVVAVVAVLFRRRAPLVVLLVTLVALSVGDSFLAAEIALFTVAAAVERRSWAIAGAIGLLVAQMIPTPLGWPPSISSWALEFLYAVLAAAAPLLLGILLQARQVLLRQLDEIKASSHREQALVTQTALGVERARLAREMHDVVAHNVSLIAIQAGALRLTASDPSAAEGATTIRELSVRTLEELRHMVGLLRATGARTDELAPQPVLADVPRLVESSGLAVELAIDPDAALVCTSQVERAAYRTVQEGLTNVNKHAPGAPVTIEVFHHPTSLSVTVVNGPPAVAGVAGTVRLPSGGHGLIGLRERAKLLGGTLRYEPVEDGGFLLQAIFPITD